MSEVKFLLLICNIVVKFSESFACFSSDSEIFAPEKEPLLQTLLEEEALQIYIECLATNTR